jgi:hypothetical protein
MKSRFEASRTLWQWKVDCVKKLNSNKIERTVKQHAAAIRLFSKIDANYHDKKRVGFEAVHQVVRNDRIKAKLWKYLVSSCENTVYDCFNRWKLGAQLIQIEDLARLNQTKRLAHMFITRATKLDSQDKYTSLARAFRRWADNPAHMFKNAIQVFNNTLNTRIKEAFSRWRLRNSLINHAMAARRVKLAIENLQSNTFMTMRAAFTLWKEDRKAKVIMALRRMLWLHTSGVKSALYEWNTRAKMRTKSLIMKYIPRLTNLFRVYEKAQLVNMKNAFECWRTNRDDIKRRALLRILRNKEENQKLTILAFKHRVEKLEIVKKVQGAIIVKKLYESRLDEILKRRFVYWNGIEPLRKYRLLKKYLIYMIYYARLNYENSFWRWKWIKSKGAPHELVTPKHSILIRRLEKSMRAYKRRLVQFGFFKLILHFRQAAVGRERLSMQFALGSLLQASMRASSPFSSRPVSVDQSAFFNRSLPNLSPDREVLGRETPILGDISQIAASKLSPDEISQVNKAGAAEVIGINLREVKTRQLFSAFHTLQSFCKAREMFEEERQKLTETITLLEEDIKGLLEDNKTLRQHNENLLDKVEANKEGQEQDSADMNENILNILVNSLSKLAQIPMMEAFIMMKNQSGFL